jgi:hypothetical protein
MVMIQRAARLHRQNRMMASSAVEQLTPRALHQEKEYNHHCRRFAR